MLVFWFERVCDQIVDIDADFHGGRLFVIDAHHDAARVDIIDEPATPRTHRGPRVHRDGALKACADQRLFRAQARHRLPLHVGAHQRAVRVVVLEERNQRRGYRHDLRRRHVPVLDAIRRGEAELVLAAACDQLVGELVSLVELGVGLRDRMLTLFDRRQIVDFVVT